MARMLKISEQIVDLEEYFLSRNRRQIYKVLGLLSPAELRRCCDKESAVGNRRWVLVLIKKRLAKLALDEELANIVRATAHPAPKGRYRLTPDKLNSASNAGSGCQTAKRIAMKSIGSRNCSS